MEATPRTRIVRGELGESRWVLARRVPHPALARFVLRLEGYEERAPGPARMREFPEPYVVVIVELGPPLRVTLGGDAKSGVRHRGGFVAGLGDAFAETEHGGLQRGIQINLTTTGARRLFALPLCALTGRIVALSDLLPATDRALAERLEETQDWTERLDVVEALLAERILPARVDTRHVDWAVERIEAAGGALDVGCLARELGYSHKHLIALFRDQVGVPPKLLARLVRFERTLRRAREGGATRGAELAVACGYYDQSHLARDVRQFTGLTLTEARARLSDLATLLG